MVSSTEDLPLPDVKSDSTTAKATPLSSFDPERAKVAPRIRNVRDDDLPYISTPDMKNSNPLIMSHETLLGPSTPTEVNPVVDANVQKTILEARQVRQESPSCNSAPVPQVDKPDVDRIQAVGSLDPDELLRASRSHFSHSVSPIRADMSGEHEPLRSASTLPEPIQVDAYNSPKQLPTKCTTDRAVPTPSVGEQGSTIFKSNETVEGNRSLQDPNASTSPTLGCTGPPEPKKPHTNRELARIALVAANGTGMAALQVIDWLASRFSYLQKGQGAWEKSLKSVLSRKPEFHRLRAAGPPHESRVLYSFANAATRAKYEKEYQSYLPSAVVPDPQGSRQKARKSVPQRHGADTVEQHEGIQNGPTSHIKKSVTKAIKSAPSHQTVTIRDSLPLPNLAEVTSNNNAMFNPFERTTAPRPKIALTDDSEIKHETSFRSVYPRDIAPSIETMTPEEKAAKIAEIKARPSRKQFFGATWRLAHVRRYERRDVHDQSDGAWRPNSTTERSMSEENSAMNDCDENRSLLQVFNLPTNALPFSDGNELAFRDGTLVRDL